MKNSLQIITIVMVVFMIGCKKDDYIPIVGVCPLVMSTSPANGAAGVALNQVVRVTFNTKMNPLTITQESLSLRGPGPVQGVISYTDSTATFTPASLLIPNTTYTGTVTTMVKDITGNAMQENYVWTFVTGPARIPFNNLLRFGVFAETGISNFGNTQIMDMDIAVHTTRNNITGFPPGEVLNGNIFAMDDVTPGGVPAMITLAKADFLNVYQVGAGMLSPAKVLFSTNQGGQVLIPGIYKTTGDLTIHNGNLTLNARGDENAVWIFQVAGNMSTQSSQGGNINLINGAQSDNVYWIIDNTVTLGTSTAFHGNLFALNSVSLNPGVNVSGRIMSYNGSVSLNNNIIIKP